MTTAVRILAAVALLFPAGLMMGMAFPLGMKLAAGARVGSDAVALGPERRGVGDGVGAERLHRADLVDLDRVLGGLALLRRGVRRVPTRCLMEVARRLEKTRDLSRTADILRGLIRTN